MVFVLALSTPSITAAGKETRPEYHMVWFSFVSQQITGQKDKWVKNGFNKEKHFCSSVRGRTLRVVKFFVHLGSCVFFFFFSNWWGRTNMSPCLSIKAICYPPLLPLLFTKKCGFACTLCDLIFWLFLMKEQGGFFCFFFFKFHCLRFIVTMFEFFNCALWILSHSLYKYVGRLGLRISVSVLG